VDSGKSSFGEHKFSRKKTGNMPLAGQSPLSRAESHFDWSGRYTKNGDLRKAEAHFGRALEYGGRPKRPERAVAVPGIGIPDGKLCSVCFAPGNTENMLKSRVQNRLLGNYRDSVAGGGSGGRRWAAGAGPPAGHGPASGCWVVAPRMPVRLTWQAGSPGGYRVPHWAGPMTCSSHLAAA
jgi:hypothetical protein